MTDDRTANPYEAPREVSADDAQGVSAMPTSVMVSIVGSLFAILGSLALIGITIADLNQPIDSAGPHWTLLVTAAVVFFWHLFAIYASIKRIQLAASNLAAISFFLAYFFTGGFLLGALNAPFMREMLGPEYERFFQQLDEVSDPSPDYWPGSYREAFGIWCFAIISIGCWIAAIAIFAPSSRQYFGQCCPNCGSVRFRLIIGLRNPGKVRCRDCKTLWRWSRPKSGNKEKVGE